MTSSFSFCKKGGRAGRCKESRIHHTGNLKLTPVFQNPAKLTLSKIHVHKKSCMHLSAVPNLQVLHLLVLRDTHTHRLLTVHSGQTPCLHTRSCSNTHRGMLQDPVRRRAFLSAWRSRHVRYQTKLQAKHRLNNHYVTPCCWNGTLSPSATVKIVRAETFLLSVQNTYADRRHHLSGAFFFFFF